MPCLAAGRRLRNFPGKWTQEPAQIRPMPARSVLELCPLPGLEQLPLADVLDLSPFADKSSMSANDDLAWRPMPIPIRSVSDLGAAIRDRRRALDLSQRELAERVGVSRQWIVEIEGGKSRAQLGLVLRTLEALGVNLAMDDGSTASAPGPAISSSDIDALLDRARGRKP